MADMKKPFYKVATEMLNLASSVVGRERRKECFTEISTILKILHSSSDIPAAKAHEIAVGQASLPKLLQTLGQSSEAMYARQVLEDLAGRVDPPPQSLHAAKAEGIADAMNDGLDEEIPDSRDYH